QGRGGGAGLSDRLRLEGLCADRQAVRHRAAGRVARGRASARTPVHAFHQGGCRPARREHQLRGSRADHRCRLRPAGARRHTGAVQRGGGLCGDQGHHHRRHQVRIRHRRAGYSASDGRGAHTGFVAILGRRAVSGRHQSAFLRQADRAQLAGAKRLEQAATGAAGAGGSAAAHGGAVQRSAGKADRLEDRVVSELESANAPETTTTAPQSAPPSTIVEPNEEGIARAVAALRAGELVAFPTETVYGLGADAANAEAVRRIFKLKGRPADHPVIVHIGDAAQLDDYASEVPPEARRLAERFWPGPLTLILKRAAHVPDIVTGGQDTVGLRVPAHPVARTLLEAFGGGIAAPSANKFGRISPTTAAHVAADYGQHAPLILDGEAASVGIESTIVDL